MKRNKLLFLLFLITTTCTGCSIEYNLNITKDNIEETIYVTDYISSNRTKKEILNHYNMWYPTYVNFITKGESIEIEDFSKKIDGIEYHDKNIIELNNGYKYTYKYKYPINKYHDSYVLASSFAETTVYKKTNSLVLKTSDESFLCNYNYFDNVKINVTIDPEIYKLNYTNSSSKNNNTYTWNINKNNCNNSEIILTLDILDKENSNINSNNNENKKKKSMDSYVIYIFLIIMILIIFFGYKWFMNFKDKNNDID